MRFKKNMYIFVSILVVVAIVISIAYATLSTNLTVKYSKVTQSSQTWNVGFVPASSVSATALGTSSTGRSCGTATVTANSVTVANTTLSKPGDACRWELQIQNTGTIDAKLSEIQYVMPTGITDCTITQDRTQMDCGNISYKMSSNESGGTRLVANGNSTSTTKVDAGDTITVYLHAIYLPTDSVNATAVEHNNVQTKLIFIQK